MRKVYTICILLLLFTGAFISCRGKERLKVGTTTSLYDTGLLDLLEEMFEKKEGIDIQFLPVGTGICLEYGRRGDVDCILVHSPEDEEKFMMEGYGVLRKSFAYNYFLIAGPANDPAGIKGKSPEEAMKLIYEGGMKGKLKFISRGDNSGTHRKEVELWKRAGFDYEKVRRSGSWYLEVGKGMGQTLLMANEMGAYTLSDSGTFLAFREKINLIPLVEKGKALLNIYSIILINPKIKKHINYKGAKKLLRFITSEEFKKVIRDYGRKKYGKSLFYPLD